MPYTTTASGLQFEDLVVGTGPKARRNVVVHYTGWLYEGGMQGEVRFQQGPRRALHLPCSARAW